jgi:multicomponent Na+:H+ antiporter subunit G
MDYALAIVTAVLLLAGAFFALVAAIGIARLPDLYTRMHAASKAGTVGSGLLLLAAGLYSGELAVLARALAGFLFFILTAPVSAHLLARASHVSGHFPADISVRDDMRMR